MWSPQQRLKNPALVMTQPNFDAKLFNVAACRSGANDDTASDTIVVG